MGVCSVAIVTTCKGRLPFLKQSLPTWLTLPVKEIIVVDNHCPDGTADWVASLRNPRVTTVRNPAPNFSISKCRNTGAIASTATWLAFIDTDILLAPQFATAFANLTPNHFYRVDRPTDGLVGQTLFERDAFDRLGGYDEVYRGYGDEDSDVSRRLGFHRYTPAYLPSALMRHLPHDDAARTRHMSIADKHASNRANTCYGLAKIDIMNIVGRELDLQLRQHLYDTITARCHLATETNTAQHIELDLPQTVLAGVRLARKYTVTLKPDSGAGQLVFSAP